jgi:uncharacterized membrane protein YdjX (TVP38/TMEM64 family)
LPRHSHERAQAVAADRRRSADRRLLCIRSRRFFDLGWFKTQQQALTEQVDAAPWASAAIYFAIYVVVTALSLPGAVVMTLAGGALFGFVKALVIVSFASSLGALLAFLIARLLLRDWVQARFGTSLESINRGVEKDGALYLFTLRLVPAFPFFVVNLAMALTALPARTFYWVSQLGMLAGTVVFVNAGTQLAQVESLSGILSPGLIGAFVLLGIFPLIARKMIDIVRARSVFKRWPKPGAFRLQHGRDRRRQCWAGDGLHRGGGEGQGRADRAASHGRRLSEYRLRAVQGPDPLGAPVVADRRRALARRARSKREVRFRRCDGTGVPRGPRYRTP